MWPARYLALAEFVARWSKDPSTKVGSVIFRADGSVISLGYNGFARGALDAPEMLADRDLRLKLTIHAEENAILSAGRNGTPLHGAKIVVTHHPCARCASKIVQAGIAEVWWRRDATFDERWRYDIELARTLFEGAGVKMFELEQADECDRVGRQDAGSGQASVEREPHQDADENLPPR